MDPEQEDRIKNLLNETDELLEGKKPNIVKVQYMMDGVAGGREYSYYSEEQLNVGDLLKVPVGLSGVMKARVSSVNVSGEEIESFKDKVKTIPAGSKYTHQPEPEKSVDETQGEVEVAEILEESSDSIVYVPINIPEESQEENLFPNILPASETAILRIAPDKDEAVIKFREEVLKVQKTAFALVVDSPDSEKDATDDLALISELGKSIDKKRREYVDPLNGHVKEINEAFKMISGPLEEIYQNIRGKLTEYKVNQERKRKEAEELNRQSIELARQQAEKNAGEFTVDITPVEAQAGSKISRAQLATSTLKDNWKWKAVDLGAIPREYLVPDEAMLDSIAKKHHDKKPVAGIEFYNEPGIQVSKRKQ